MDQQAGSGSRPSAVLRRGVVCPRCACADLRVLNTRYSPGRIVRYRQCRNCGRRVTTYEVTPAGLAKTGRQGRQ